MNGGWGKLKLFIEFFLFENFILMFFVFLEFCLLVD